MLRQRFCPRAAIRAFGRACSLATLGLAAPIAAAAVTAGVAVVDSTAQVGHAAGQYAGDTAGQGDAATFVGDHGVDPATFATRRRPSYGVESRESVRALVVDGQDRTGASKRVAIVANDLYIPQDLLNRRVSGILEQFDLEVGLGLHPGMQGTGISSSNMAICVSHSHSSPYYSSPSWGVWAFQDVFDIRFYERFAQDMAKAVIAASQQMVPVRMGASVRPFGELHRHSYGPQVADDGTPSGYPQTDNDKTVVVARFDDLSDPENPVPLAHFVTYGGHPEMLSGNDLLSSEYVHRMYQFVDRAIDPDGSRGHVTLMCQQNVGTAEPGRNANAQPPEARAEYSHREYAQITRAGRLLADAVLGTSQDIENETPAIPGVFSPFAAGFVVDIKDLRFAPPSNRLLPTVSNCRTQEYFEANPGIPIVGLPDCGYFVPAETSEQIRREVLPFDPAVTYDVLQDAGVPLPTGVSAPSYTGLQETLQVHLQAIRFGDVGVTVCPCEQFADQSREIKSRLDAIPDNNHVGFDYTDTPGWCTQNAETSWSCKNPQNPAANLAPVSDEQFSRMESQINNDAAGWEDPIYAELYAESEPADPAHIRGNYTREEQTAHAYEVVMPISMSNDYWGYIVTYREYQAKDHYRKALTGLGPHSSDFFATRLSRMAAELNGGPPVALAPKDTALSWESTHQMARQAALGAAASAYLPAYEATRPSDGGTPRIVAQPADIQRFSAAELRWVGGSNYFDVPVVRVERLEEGVWKPFEEQRGAIQMLVNYPQVEDMPAYEAGTFEWTWVATFEAYDSDIAIPDVQGRVHRPATASFGSQIPNGTYRFVIDGVQHEAPSLPLSPLPANTPYHLVSDAFDVGPWQGITVEDLRIEGSGDVSFAVGPVHTFYGVEFGPIDYPDSYASPFTQFIREGVAYSESQRNRIVYAGGHQEQFCFRCTFRPWRDIGDVASASVRVTRAGGVVETVAATREASGRWLAATALQAGDTARVEPGGVVDIFGETNGQGSSPVAGSALPEPGTLVSWVIGLVALAALWLVRRRSRARELVVALAIALVAPIARGASIDVYPAAAFQGGFGERVTGVANNTSYFAQSFVAPNGTLDELRFVLAPQSPAPDNAGDNVFRLLITETVGGTEISNPELIRPAAVVYESIDLTLPLAGPQTEFSVLLGGLSLTPGATYAWVLDAFVAADSVPGKSSVGEACCDDPYADGHFFFLNLTDGSGSTRAEHFDRVWNDFPDQDLAFRLFYTPIPEPGTGALFALGLAALARASRTGTRRAPHVPGALSNTPGQRVPQARQRPSPVRFHSDSTYQSRPISVAPHEAQ